MMLYPSEDYFDLWIGHQRKVIAKTKIKKQVFFNGSIITATDLRKWSRMMKSPATTKIMAQQFF